MGLCLLPRLTISPGGDCLGGDREAPPPDIPNDIPSAPNGRTGEGTELSKILHEPCSQGIQMNIAHQLGEIGILLADNGFVSILEQMPLPMTWCRTPGASNRANRGMVLASHISHVVSSTFCTNVPFLVSSRLVVSSLRNRALQKPN